MASPLISRNSKMQENAGMAKTSAEKKKANKKVGVKRLKNRTPLVKNKRNFVCVPIKVWDGLSMEKVQVTAITLGHSL